MTAKQILDIISANMTIEQFAYGDFELPDNMDFLPEKELSEWNDYNLKYNAYKNHPGYSSNGARNEEFELLKQAYYNTKIDFEKFTKLWLEYLGIGEIEEVEQYGGEGLGDSWYSVKYFKDHDIYIRTDGYYTSYNGTDFEQGYGNQVFKKEKTITVYE